MSSIRRSVQVHGLAGRARDRSGCAPSPSSWHCRSARCIGMLLDLEEEAIVERTPDGEWDLSFRLLEITGLQLERIEFPALARPFCRAHRRSDPRDRQHQCAERTARGLRRQGARQRGHAARYAHRLARAALLRRRRQGHAGLLERRGSAAGARRPARAAHRQDHHRSGCARAGAEAHPPARLLDRRSRRW